MISIEYSKNSHEKCQCCGRRIETGTIRICTSAAASPYSRGSSTKQYHHAACYSNRKDFTKFYGFQNLMIEHQKMFLTEEQKRKRFPSDYMFQQPVIPPQYQHLYPAQPLPYADMWANALPYSNVGGVAVIEDSPVPEVTYTPVDTRIAEEHDSNDDGGKKKAKKKKAKKDPNAPKRPRTAYIFYSIATRATVRESYPGATFGDLTKIISKRYKELTVEERAPWEEKSAQDKKRYKREMAAYKSEAVESEMENKENIVYAQ